MLGELFKRKKMWVQNKACHLNKENCYIVTNDHGFKIVLNSI